MFRKELVIRSAPIMASLALVKCASGWHPPLSYAPGQGAAVGHHMAEVRGNCDARVRTSNGYVDGDRDALGREGFSRPYIDTFVQARDAECLAEIDGVSVDQEGVIQGR